MISNKEDMFKTDLARKNWSSKYKYKDETPLGTYKRLAKAGASVEITDELKKYWEQEFLNSFIKFDAFNNAIGIKSSPGGRITANAGTEYQNTTMFNCYINGPVKNATISYSREVDGLTPINIKYVTPNTGDNLMNIFLTILEQAKTLASEGGWGINIGFIRPRSSIVKGIGVEHPGIVRYLEIFDKVSDIIVSGNNDGYNSPLKNYLEELGYDNYSENLYSTFKSSLNQKVMARKGAMMVCLDVSHPDIEEFIIAKQKPGYLTKFNMSVMISDDFMDAVNSDNLWELKFDNYVYKVVKARDLYDLIMTSTYNRAEPGVLFYDNMQKNNPFSYAGKINATNPCIVGDTLIATADGRNAVKISQLANEGIDVPIYSTNVETGKVEIKYGRNPRKTGIKKEVWKLTLDDGSHLIATPDHSILLKSLKYVQLKDLNVGDSISPFYSFNSNKYRQISYSGQKMIGGHRRNRRQYRLIHEFFNGVVNAKEFTIHHKDFNSFNDNIDNLIVMTHVDHVKLHTDKMSGTSNPYHFMTNEWKHNFASKPGSKNGKWINITNEELVLHGKKLFEKDGKITTHSWMNYAKKNRLPQTLDNTARFENFNNFVNQVASNHKVLSVEFYGYEDVYNITVDDNHNYNVITSYEDDKYITSSGICIKNCGEIGGNPVITTVCLLLSINLTQYVNPDRTFNFNQYMKDLAILARFTDNINDLQEKDLDPYLWAIKNVRQYGMGLNGFGSTLYMMGIQYGSSESIKLAERLNRAKLNQLLKTSALLAQEKGKAPAFTDEYYNTYYWKTWTVGKIDDDVRLLVEKYGLRNLKQTTSPPLGNSSVIQDNVSNGLEPVFSWFYDRTYIVNDFPDGLNQDNVKTILKETKIADSIVWEGDYNGKRYYYEPYNRGLCIIERVYDYGYMWVLENFKDDIDNNADYLITTANLSVNDHINIQEAFQKYIDQSVSKTCNIPNNYPYEDFKELYMDAWKRGLNGFTTYREGTMESVLTKIEETNSGYEMPDDFDTMNDDWFKLVLPNVELPEEFVNGSTKVIEREGKKFYIHFSYLPEDYRRIYPVAMWVITNHEYNGEAVYVNRAVKSLENLLNEFNINSVQIDNVLDKIKKDTPNNKIAKLVSMCLRHHIPIASIVMSLENLDGDNISSLLTAIRKFLSSHIKDGTIIQGKVCTQCSSTDIIFESGCSKCRSCGSSNCG